jgi:signal peptidase II
MHRAKRIALLFFIMFLFVGCDQATKSVAQNQLRYAEPIVYLNGMVRLQYAENYGAFLSLGARLPETAQRWIFVGAVTVILAGLLLYALWESHRVHFLLLLAFALILGGGFGNLIDRVVNDGYVVDFLNVGIGRLRTGIFNVADMALMAGVGLVILFGLRSSEDKDSPEQTDAEA